MSADPVATQRFEDYVRHHMREHELIHQAQNEAKIANDYRLAALNDLRKDVERDRELYMLKSESSLRYNGLEERVRRTEDAVSKSQSATATWIIAGGIFITLINIAIRVFL